MIYEAGEDSTREQWCIDIARISLEKQSGRLASILMAKIIHKTYNHGVTTGYSVMLQCKCEEQRRAKITPQDLYKKREQDASRKDFEGTQPTQISRFSRSFR